MLKKIAFLFLVMAVLLPSGVFAQDAEIASEEVSIAASDGLALIGDFYRPTTEEPVYAVLLLHMLGNRRQSWEPLIPDLLNANLAVLAIDMRGHGATKGKTDWALAEQDVQTLVDWLKAQEGIQGVAIVGASIGSNLTLRGTANDPSVFTAVALSPGLDYRGVTTDDAVAAIGDRPILLVASRSDNPSGTDVVTLFGLATGETQLRLYDGRLHGTDMFAGNHYLGPMIASWIVEHAPK